MPPITIEEFRKWLQSLPPEEVVAQEWTSCDCPVAKWLLTFPEVKHVSVGDTGWVFINHGQGRGDGYHSCSWLMMFVRAIDKRRIVRLATASDCLEVLDYVENKLKEMRAFYDRTHVTPTNSDAVVVS